MPPSMPPPKWLSPLVAQRQRLLNKPADDLSLHAESDVEMRETEDAGGAPRDGHGSMSVPRQDLAQSEPAPCVATRVAVTTKDGAGPSSRDNLAVDDVVMLVDETMPRYSWNLAKVISVFDNDSHVRKVKVRRSDGTTLTKDRTKVVQLELKGIETKQNSSM